MSRRRIIPLSKTLEPYTHEIAVGKSYGWDINKNNSKKYIMMFHGMGQNISNLQALYEDILNETDYAIFAPEYRGFGKNQPSILSKETFREDSNNAYNYLINEKKIKPEDIIVMGHSFGSFVATQFVENKQDIQHMILISPLDSSTTDSIKMNKGLRRRLPPFVIFLFDHFDFLKKSYVDIFDTNSHLKNIKTPVSIIHSQNDNTIKAVSARKLANMCPNLNKLQILQNGGHQMEKNKINAIIELLK